MSGGSDPLLGALLSDTRAVVSQLLDAPLASPDVLRAEVDAALERLGRTRPAALTDVALGKRIALRCLALLGLWDGLDLRGRKLVQVAVRYFVTEDDGIDDNRSPFGFDDDAEVVEAVAQALGLPPIDVYGGEGG